MPTALTTLGRVRGFRDTAFQLDVFRGIPYAAPPVGELRFRPPAPGTPWSGVREATEFGPSAPQLPVPFDLIPGLGVGETDEDCLTLNVYTPACDGGRRPVLVWIHGGAFTIGSGSQMMYDPRPLARRGDVVIVTVNYRLGALGFLALCDREPATTANAGLLDQVAALRFVRANAAAFGGDPERTTVFGESAGGMSVGCLLGMPAAGGLFRGAIPMSGAASSANAPETALRVRDDLCRELGVAAGDVGALRRAPVAALLEAQRRCEAAYQGGALRMGFRPNLDAELAAGDAVFPVPPLEALRAGAAADVDVLVGSTRDEWRLFGLMDPEAARLDWAGLVARVQARAPGHGERIADAYREARPGASPADLFFAIESDRLFRIPALRLADARDSQPGATFTYLFTWESPMLGGRLGACHGIDVPFVFGLVGSEGAEKFAGGGPQAKALSERAMDAWLGLARQGDPGHPGLPAWPRHDPTTRPTLLFGPEVSLVHDPLGRERAAWDGL